MSKKKKKQTKKSIRPGKNIVSSNVDSLNNKLLKIIEQGFTELSLDFTNVKSVDPVGLSVIAAAHNTMKNAGSKLFLKNIPDEINILFNELAMDKHFNIEQ